jgi:methyl-accepting chemotaxis protein
VRELADMVRDASAQQTQGFTQVTKALEDIEKATQSTAATAEESAAASETLNAEAEVSLSHVRRLETIVDGRSPEHQAVQRQSVRRLDATANNVVQMRRAS